MQNEFTKSYSHVGASFQNLSLGPKSPLGSAGYDSTKTKKLVIICVHMVDFCRPGHLCHNYTN